MKILYITSANIASYSENSNAFQQPYNLCLNSECTVLVTNECVVNPEIDEIVKGVIKTNITRSQLVLDFLGMNRVQLPVSKVDLNSFDAIISDFSEWSVGIARVLLRYCNVPWYVVLWDPPFGNRYEIKKGILSYYERKVRALLYNRMISSCEGCFSFINKGVIDEEGLEFRNVKQMVNGVDIDSIDRMMLPRYESKTPFAICAIGRVRIDKGCMELLGAFEIIGSKFPQSKLTMIGQIDGNEDEKILITKMLKEHPFSERIFVTGRQSFRETMSIAVGHQIGLHAYSPSKYLYWNHVLKVGEYQALGVVPVAVRYPGTLDIISDQETGVLVNSNSKVDIGEAVIGLFNDPKLLDKIRLGALDRIGQRSWKRVTARMVESIDNEHVDERL
ncbi:glycosyltransferase [Dyadobacter bucti]|uniref:glycosyltransferase n=1 Tax=Dyadobacter bucti TaxID=2572203 RepID=UPI003F6FCF42